MLHEPALVRAESRISELFNYLMGIANPSLACCPIGLRQAPNLLVFSENHTEVGGPTASASGPLTDIGVSFDRPLASGSA